MGAVALPQTMYRIAPPENFLRYPYDPIVRGYPIIAKPPVYVGPQTVVQQAPPVDSPQPAATCASPSYVDAAGNCTSDWHNPYSLYLPAIPPSNTVAAQTSATSTVAQAPALSWFTDPNQEVLSGFPNWGLVAAAAGLLMFMRGRR
jgi:hypothetical protein